MDTSFAPQPDLSTDAVADISRAPQCIECLDDPAQNTAHGICLECGSGDCAECAGERVTYVLVTEDTEREVPCRICGNADIDGPDADRDDVRQDWARHEDSFQRDVH